MKKLTSSQRSFFAVMLVCGALVNSAPAAATDTDGYHKVLILPLTVKSSTFGVV